MNTKKYCLNVSGDEYLIGKLMSFLDFSEKVKQPSVDPENPYEPVHVGVVKTECNGRKTITYIPTHFTTSGAGVFVFLENGNECNKEIDGGIWQKLSELHDVAIIMLEPLSRGWDQENIQNEINYVQNVFQQALNRNYFSLNESTYYAIGIGEGAYPAATFCLLYSSIFAGFATDGDCNLHPDLLSQLSMLPSDGDRSVTKIHVPIPAWIVDRKGENKELVNYLKTANSVCDHYCTLEHCQIYSTDLKKYKPSVNGLPIFQLRYSTDEHVSDWSPDQEYDAFLTFLLARKRWMDGANGGFRPARNIEDLRLHRYEMIHNGLHRHWYIFVPKFATHHPNQKLPIVVALHGYSCTGKLFAENSEWQMVADQRNFILAYPTAYPGNWQGLKTPLPFWNCGQFLGESGIDDMSFILDMLEDIKQNYFIDETRIYVAGHSNGSGMTQKLMQDAGGVFAAFGPVGYTFGEALNETMEKRSIEIPMDGLTRPVWLIKGENDIGCAASLEPWSANNQFLEIVRKANGCTSESYCRNGNWKTHTWYNKDLEPVLKFTDIVDLPHTYTPEMAQRTWDEFFCHYRRLPDGKIEYQG